GGDPVRRNGGSPADRPRNVHIRVRGGWHWCPAGGPGWRGRGGSGGGGGGGGGGATCHAAPPWYHAAVPARAPRGVGSRPGRAPGQAAASPCPALLCAPIRRPAGGETRSAAGTWSRSAGRDVGPV